MRKILKHRYAKIGLEILVILLVYFAIRTYMQWHLASGTLPPLHAETLRGQLFDSTIPRKGPLLVHFWASWCPVCHLEQKSIQSLSQDYPVISIALNSGDGKDVLHFLQQQGVSFPVINDPEGDIARHFGVTGVPVSFVVDANNQVRFVESGYTTGWGLRLRMWLAD